MSPAKRISAESLDNLPQCRPEAVAPARAWRCVQQLGEGFAKWMFHPALLQQAAKYLQANGDHAGAQALCQRPQLPGLSGCCWVVFVVTPPGSYSCLQAAFVLPLRWQLGTSHSSALPQTLIRLADDVLERLRQEANNNSPYHEAWGLHLAPGTGLEDYDLSLLQSISCNSGFVSLAAGLVVAAEGGIPRGNVWASASWSDDLGPSSVDGLAAKLRLAADWGATDFFVAGSQANDAQAEAAQQHLTLAIHGLAAQQPATSRGGKSEPVKAVLKPYLLRLETPPAADAAPQQRTAYYLRLRPSEPDVARRYYRDCMLVDIAEHCRALLPGDFAAPAVLVTVLSRSSELLSLVVKVVRPRLCVILYTPNLKNVLDYEIQELNDSLAIKVATIDIDTDQQTWLEHLPTRLWAHLEDMPPGPVCFDLTPGHKAFTVGLFMAARPGDKLLYLAHKFENGFIPWTEQPLVWDAPATLAPPPRA